MIEDEFVRADMLRWVLKWMRVWVVMMGLIIWQGVANSTTTTKAFWISLVIAEGLYVFGVVPYLSRMSKLILTITVQDEEAARRRREAADQAKRDRALEDAEKDEEYAALLARQQEEREKLIADLKTIHETTE